MKHVRLMAHGHWEEKQMTEINKKFMRTKMLVITKFAYTDVKGDKLTLFNTYKAKHTTI